jgi:hypothetical protein
MARIHLCWDDQKELEPICAQYKLALAIKGDYFVRLESATKAHALNNIEVCPKCKSALEEVLG